MPDISAYIPIIGTVACAAIAALSPFLTALANNKFQMSMKKLEIFEVKRIEVIESYISCTDKCIEYNCLTDDYASVRSKIYLYVDSSLWGLLDSINSALESHSPVEARSFLREFCRRSDINMRASSLLKSNRSAQPK